MKSQIVRVESDSEPGKSYEIDLTALTCTCPYHNRKLRTLPLDDPHRLCKHLVKMLAVRGVPDVFKAYEGDIKWFAEHNASFTTRDKALARQKEQNYQKAKDHFTPDQIVVLSRNKKRKYYYIEANAIERPISATVRLDDGETWLKISNLSAYYSFTQNVCSFPDAYRFMAPAIILWLDIEYADLTGCNRVRSDENIIAMYNQMTNPRQEIPPGSIVTVSRERKPGQQDMIEWGEWTEEPFNCDFVRAHVEKQNGDGIYEPTDIEAIISLPANFLLFRINLSSCVKLFFKEAGQRLILSTSYDGKGYTLTTDHEFPKRLSYIKRAIFVWLEDEIRKAQLNPGP